MLLACTAKFERDSSGPFDSFRLGLAFKLFLGISSPLLNKTRRHYYRRQNCRNSISYKTGIFISAEILQVVSIVGNSLKEIYSYLDYVNIDLGMS